MFITDFNEIMDVLDSSPRTFLYDTVAISKHELAYFRNNLQLSKEFVENNPIIITQTILDELKFRADTEERYTNFLKQFTKVILINETSFVKYFFEMYSPKQRSLSQYKKSAINSFRTIQPLAEAINNIKLEEAENKIIDLFYTYFSSGKNKGEYSLLWLSTVICEVFPKLGITFIGKDRDLYNIVDHCYYRFDSITSEIKSKSEVRILSDDSMLQALLRRGQSIESLVDYYRDEARKMLYRKIIDGITEPKITEGSMDNQLFLENLNLGQIEIIY
ncbi:hypothetical protein D3C73_537530 [compost metagenome]